MTERSTPQQVQVHTTTTRYDTPTNPQGRYRGGGSGGGGGGIKAATTTFFPENGPNTSQVLAILAGLPVSGILLVLAGLTLVGTLTGLAITTPLFILFSPVLVPATVIIGLSVAGFLTSGACGVTALTSFSWVTEYIRQTQEKVPEQLQSAKQGLADVVDYVGQKTKVVGQKTKEVGQEIQTKAQDAKTTT